MVKNKMVVEEMYKKKDPIQHVLDIPDTYLGSIESDTKSMYVYDDELEKIVKKDITFVPGFYKTVDELFVNAVDHRVEDSSCKIIKVTIQKDTGMIRVWNDGHGIPVVVHKEHNVYIPELIFGQLLTSSNYDRKGKTVGGKNGYGAKLANIFSKKFIVETVDANTKKRYIQEFRNNMSEKDEPTIVDVKSDTKPYTQITYYPDYHRFGMKGLTNDIISLLKKRVCDLASTRYTKGNKVYLNDKLIDIKTFEDFICMHFDKKPCLIYEEVNDRWKVGVVYGYDSGYNTVSFVNGLWTFQGGTHTEYITNQLIKNVVEHIKSMPKHKGLNIKSSQIKEHLTIFIDSVIDDPIFNSQTKETLTSKILSFGSKCELSESFMSKIYKTKLIENVIKVAEFKEMASLTQTDGKKVASVKNIEKLEDAHWAGTRKSKETRLILTEGDSAKAFAISGLDVIGRDRFGVFPLRGKVINVRTNDANKIKNNNEFKELKQILGLKQNVVYDDIGKLRYGGIIILTDQDADGSHIKGLIINMLQHFWPSLLKNNGFIQTMSTPLIKAFKKTDVKRQNPKVFYTLTQYESWVKTELNNDTSKWNIKYYKGLGTSEEDEAKEIFSDFENRIITYVWETVNGDNNENNENNNKNNNVLDIVDQKNKKNNKDEKDDVKDDDEIEKSDNKEDEEEKDEDEDENKKEEKEEKDEQDQDSDDSEIYNSKSYEAITLAFGKDREDDRKHWLVKYDKNAILEYDQQYVKYSDFINKDLIHFSNMDNIRSIPSIIDGLKPSQRKILFGAFAKDAKTEIKVAQLASYVSEQTAYKHGEASLQEAIVNMAQNFVGSNNINLLYPRGNFGYRKRGGKEHAQSRYIFTYVEPITYKIFSDLDKPILRRYEDEGDIVEPEHYYPIIPMVLVNGTSGIGTGYSTHVFPHNPLDVCNNLLKLIDGGTTVEMAPWFRGFKGSITKIEEDKYKIAGKFQIINENTIKVTEIPVCGLYQWIDKYVAYLESLVVEDKTDESKKVLKVNSNCGNNKIDIDVVFRGNELQKMVKRDVSEIEKFLKLSTTISMKNLYLYNSKDVITHYESPQEILEEFFDYRVKIYEIRRKYHLKVLENELMILKYKIRFINEYISKKIIVEKKKKDEVIERLVELKYPKLATNIEATEDEKTYQYITSMQIFSLTQEKIDELNDEYNKKKAELDDYKNTTAIEFWKREIHEFMEFYKKWLEEISSKEEIVGKKIKKNTKSIKSKVKSK